MQFNAAESNGLFDYMVHVDNRHENMHTRRVVQRNRVRVLENLNALYFEPNESFIEGYVCGPHLVEIRYRIKLDNQGIARTQIVFNSHGTHQQAMQYLTDQVRPEILKRLREGFGYDGPVNRTPGEFYLQRWANPNITQGAQNAVAAGVLTQTFVDTIRRWNIRVLQP